MRSSRRIAVIGALDTRGDEVAHLSGAIESMGAEATVIDIGVLGTPGCQASLTRDEVARAGGGELTELRRAAEAGADRELATRTMIEGGATVLRRLVDEDEVDAVVGLGGSSGTAACVAILRRLRLGLPKVMITTVASQADVVNTDIVLMQSPVDLVWRNAIVDRTLDQAAHAILAMCEVPSRPQGERPMVGVTALGVTTPAVLAVLERLRDRGADGVVFHARTELLDELVGAGVIAAVADIT
ncbi:MAG: Tm-1-like ATP-binding domain-containing protein, partial [Actinobacteria bacterium]|nr:Tm-1-like ATP-binding domain-containing protein [Actinomycetota bacterium]